MTHCEGKKHKQHISPKTCNAKKKMLFSSQMSPASGKLAATSTFKRVRLGLRFFQGDEISQFAQVVMSNINSTISQKKNESLLRRKSAFHGSFWHFDAFGFGFSYKTLDYICFGLFWNNPKGAQIGTPVPAGGLRKQARCCPSQALDPGATSESWCFEFWPSWDTSSQIFTTGKSLALFLFVRGLFIQFFES